MEERVQKIICNKGYCSRRKAEELISEGKVRVNGNVIKLGDKASGSDKIMVEGHLLGSEKKRYIAFYKPRFVTTTLNDPYCQNNVSLFLKDIKERVFPVGRLDHDAEGLLILTNDGDFANKVMHPRYVTQKTYVAELREKISKPDMERLSGKIMLNDGPVTITHSKLINPFNVEITIHEGRHKIVKRIFKEQGYYVKSLKRIRIDTISLGALKPGKFQDIPISKINNIMKK